VASAGLIVPTYNAGYLWGRWLEAYAAQRWKPARVLIIDSSSSDSTVPRAKEFGLDVVTIHKAEFNHGGTRVRGIEWLEKPEIVLFLTQDAVLAGPDALLRLREALDCEQVAAAYGRQLPHPDAGPIAAHARHFNYTELSATRTLRDACALGLKVAFLSNSFAAYRLAALEDVGGFPAHTIMNEDTYVAGKMLTRGWKISYVAEAAVHHSHDYRFSEEFRRYFDIGVFHAQQPWMRETFGAAESEGKRYVLSELRYLWRTAPWLIPSAMVRSVAKWSGYRVGLEYRHVPGGFRRACSLHRGFWRAAGEVD
jgi:rhamnosyltransferase